MKYLTLFFPIIIFCFISVFLPCVTLAQTPSSIDTSSTDDILHIEWADVFIHEQEEQDTLERLLGNVELRQDTVYMYCDSARIFNQTHLTAMGNVVIQEGDSISVFADSLVYESDTRIADLFGEVVLLRGKQKLFTNRLRYNMETNLATYYSGATLTNDTTFLKSIKGYYYVDSSLIYFRDSVVVVDSAFTLRSDTLKFNTDTQIATFLGPTLIRQDSSLIYCESGFYDIPKKSAEFRKKPQYVKGLQEATADVIGYNGEIKEVTLRGNARFEEEDRVATGNIIRYNEQTEITKLEGKATSIDGDQIIRADTITYDAKNETYATRGQSYIVNPPQILIADQVDYDKEREIGIATGNIVWRDTTEDLTIVCEFADYDNSRNYLKASGGRNGRPLFITEVDGDSLYMTSDTLVSIQIDSIENDTQRLFLGYRDVRIFKSDLQAISDSIVYNTTDSSFRFFFDPIIWSDTSQFTADTVIMQMANNKIDRILLNSESFMINTPDEQFYNQIKGKNSIAFFKEGEIREMLVEGNAESVYYALDDEEAYIGVNQAICSEMLILFGNNEVEGIKFYNKPDATLFPMKKAKHNELILPGFKWEVSKRPNDIDDLFD